METREKCKRIFAEVMEVEVSEVNDDSSPDNLDLWDSLSHVQLVLKMEKEFNIKISPEEGIDNFINFGGIVRFVTTKV